MPTYDYICKKCGHEFEEFHSISDDPVKICPECGHASVERKITGGTGLIFKGSGFYITDYSDGNAGNANSSNSSDSSSTSKATETADTKSTASSSSQTATEK
ncbi:MAG TPA: zinc ribbon domain-containing protein [bacterium]|nr:zinc ribbon domain-containing protein [bacterium]